MAITDLIFDTIVNLLYQTGYVGVFLLMVMESATLPIPSEVVLPLGGYLVYQGRLEFWSTVTVATVGSLVGTMVDFSIGYYLGRPAVLRYGRIVRFSEKRLETTEKWFGSHGKSVVLLARFVPLLRTLIAFPAGIVRMDVKRFLVYSAIGILVWCLPRQYAARSFRTLVILSGVGMKYSSIGTAYGIDGTSSPPNRFTGASSQRHASSAMSAATSDPTETLKLSS